MSAARRMAARAALLAARTIIAQIGFGPTGPMPLAPLRSL